MKTNAISILIADDHSVVRMGLAALLGAEGGFSVVGEAANGTEAVALARKLQPDVIVMDLEMPRKDGIAATTEILAACPDAKILILTSFATTDLIDRALRAGARGAIMKNADDSEMIAALRAVAAGKTYLAKDVQRLFRDEPPTPELSPRQMEILASLTRGLTNADIALQLDITIDMVKKHVNALMQKMNAANRAEAVALAIKKRLVEE